MEVKGKVSTTREKENNGRYPYHSKQEIKKKKPFKEKNVLPKERHTFPKGKGSNTSRRKIPLRFVVPPHVPLEQKWHVLQHKKFPQKLTKTQKRKMKRLRAMEKRKLLEEMPQEKPKAIENLKEEVRPTSRKTKFGRKAIEDKESSCGFDEEMNLKTIMIGTFLVSLKRSTVSLTLPYFFKSKEMEETLVELEKEHLLAEEKHS